MSINTYNDDDDDVLDFSGITYRERRAQSAVIEQYLLSIPFIFHIPFSKIFRDKIDDNRMDIACAWADELIDKMTKISSIFAIDNDVLVRLSTSMGVAGHKYLIDIDDELKRTDAIFGLARLMEQAEAMGLNINHDNMMPRLADPAWWRRGMKRAVLPAREQLGYELGLIHKNSPYSTKWGQDTRRKQIENNEKWAKDTVIKKDNIEIPLVDIINTNLHAREARHIAKVAGMKDLQDENGWSAVMVTVTCPGSFRRDGTTIKEAIKHLNSITSRVTAFKQRHNLSIASMRCTHAHKDAFPHYHEYIIGEKEELEKLVDEIKKQGMKEYSDEPGAQKRRVDIVWEDRKKGRLSSYATRYISRFNDGIKLDNDAWYSSNNIRKIAWSGLPSDMVWEASRRMTRDQADNKKARQTRKAARAGNYCQFVNLVGGVNTKRADRPCESITIIKENNYEELIKKTIGAKVHQVEIILKSGLWKLVNIAKRRVIPNYPSRGQNQSKTKSRAAILHVEPIPIPF